MYDLKFEPKTEEELIDLLEDGEGNYEVLTATRKESQENKNPMIELNLKVWDKTGETKLIRDWLMLTGTKFSLKRIRHFCYSNGMENFYNAGKLSASDCAGRKGKCEIGRGKDKKGIMRNRIQDYMLNESGIQTQLLNKSGIETPVISNASFDDDIPF